MRCLVFIDTNKNSKSDLDFDQFMREQIPGRLKLLEAEYSGMPWKATFADTEYGVESIDELAATIRRDRDDFDAIILVPNNDAVEQKAGLASTEMMAIPYLRKLSELVLAAGDVPMIAYLDEPGPRSEFNLLGIGFAAAVDQTNEPALLPMKIARAVNKTGTTGGMLTLGALTIDMKSGEASVNGHSVGLTHSERSMVLNLARAKGRIRSKEQLLKNMYTLDMDEPDIKIIDVFMTKIRSKINDKAAGLGFDVLRTAWGDGYSMLAQMPEGRLHRGLLRLDPNPDGGYLIADTTVAITDTEFELFEYLHKSLGHGVSDKDNFMMASQETLESLNSALADYLATSGTPILYDPEEGRTFLNPEYFDVELFDAGKFNSLLRQEIKSVGPYRFIRLTGANAYRLGDSDVSFTSPEVRLLESLMRVEGQALRAHSLFRQIRGESHRLRGDQTPDEDIVALAKTLYNKLEQVNLGEDDRNVTIYHDTYISFGPAEEVPDPEKITAQRRMELGERMIKRLADSAGKTVELARHDFGQFQVLVHPVLGSGIVEGHGVDLTSRQVRIIKSVYDMKPAVLSVRALHDAVFPGRPFSQQKISTDIYNLRRLLASVNPEWESVLTLVRGRGYVSLAPGEVLPEEKVENELTPDDTWEKAPVGNFTLLVHPTTGQSVIEGKTQKLNPQQTRLLKLLFEKREAQGDTPELVSETELYRGCYGDDNFEIGVMTGEVNRLRTVLRYHSEDWADALFTKRGKGYALLRAGDVLAVEEKAAPAELVPDDTWEKAPVGNFTLLVHPTTGQSVIEGATQRLHPVYTRILKTLFEMRETQGDKPALVEETTLYRAAYPNTGFVNGILAGEINRLRNILRFHSEDWADALITKRGKGFALLRDGDDMTPEEKIDNDITPDATWHKVPAGYFTMLVHPVLGQSIIDGKGQKLTPRQTLILKTLHEKRETQGDAPQVVNEADLYRAVYGDNNFEMGVMSSEVRRLREVLRFHSNDWAEALVTKRNKGYALLRAGDVLPVEETALRPVRQAKVETPWEEVILTGGLKMLRDPETGKSRLDGIDYVWSQAETLFMELLSSRYPETVFTAEIERATKTGKASQFASDFHKRWDIRTGGVACPFEKSRNGMGAAWILAPIKEGQALPDINADDDTPQAAFAFGKAANGMCHSEALNAPFTAREAELLTLLEARMGAVLDMGVICSHSKLKWDAKVTLSTLENVQRKIAGINPALAARLQYSKRTGTMGLAFPPRALKRVLQA